jgi:hypothetical protein
MSIGVYATVNNVARCVILYSYVIEIDSSKAQDHVGSWRVLKSRCWSCGILSTNLTMSDISLDTLKAFKLNKVLSESESDTTLRLPLA